jgi:hypothetical protein
VRKAVDLAAGTHPADGRQPHCPPIRGAGAETFARTVPNGGEVAPTQPHAGASRLTCLSQLIPAGFVIAAVLSFNFLGDGLRDTADPYQ